MCVTPRKAATVAVLRDVSGKMEVLLLKRHPSDRFLPDHCVFPGGALDDQDFDFSFPADEIKSKDFEGDPKLYYGYIMCGIRETFEESGILLAVDRNGSYPDICTEDSVMKYSRYREAVFEKKLSFMEMLGNEKLTPAVENFYYLNRWITPPLFPIRYDTRFFVTRAPGNQMISHDGNELVDFEWITPAEGLNRYRRNKIKLVMPTIKTLEFLGKFSSSPDVFSRLSGEG